jgi:hypothetical protein
MALVLADRVQETSTTTGTGTFTLDGAIAGYVSFAAIGDGNTTYYTIVGGVQWEVGIGTYTASETTLSRDTVLSSSSGDSLVDFPAGSKTVFVTYPAERAVYENATGAVVSADVTAINVTATNANITSTLITDEFITTNANITSSLITDEFTATNANVSVLNASSSVISAEFDNTGVFYYNTKTITANTTIGNTTNAMSVGPITIADEVVVTVSDGGEWVIV